MAAESARSFQSFGVIPAAGYSRRMGQPKLKMAWGTRTIIEQVVEAWQRGGVEHVVAAIRADDVELARLCERAGAIVVTPPVPPPQMKDSVNAALRAIAARFQPRDDAVWLLAPADMPRLSPAVIVRLLAAHRSSQPAILVPTYDATAGDDHVRPSGKKRGHPVLFPWPSAQDVAGLSEDEGVNVLLSRHPVREIAVNEPVVLDDLDTVADYRRLAEEEGHM